MQYEKVTITTAADGSATVLTRRPINGKLLGIYYEVGDLDTGWDATVTEEQSGAPVDTITNGGTSNVWRKPMIPAYNPAGTATTAPAHEPMPIHGQLKWVIAQGGASKTGYAHVYSE